MLALEAEFLAEEILSELWPVDVRIGHVVGVEVASGTAEFCRKGHIAQSAQLLLETVDVDHHLLAKTRRRCRLSVSTGQHGHVAPLLSVIVKLLNKLLQQRNVDIVDSLLEREGYSSVVDVLRSETEMNEIEVNRLSRSQCQLLLDKILHCLDVVVGDGLNLFHTLCIALRELLIDIAQHGESVMRKVSQLRQRQLAKGNEIFYLNTHTIAYERKLREIV